MADSNKVFIFTHINQKQNTMKILVIILGLIRWVIEISMSIVVMCLGIVCYHWIIKQIQIIYPEQIFSEWFRMLIMLGCFGLCVWVLEMVHKKPTIKIKVDKKVIEHKTV